MKKKLIFFNSTVLAHPPFSATRPTQRDRIFFRSAPSFLSIFFLRKYFWVVYFLNNIASGVQTESEDFFRLFMIFFIRHICNKDLYTKGFFVRFNPMFHGKCIAFSLRLLSPNFTFLFIYPVHFFHYITNTFCENILRKAYYFSRRYALVHFLKQITLS